MAYLLNGYEHFITEAATYQQIPREILKRVLAKEGCRNGGALRNKDGSTDYGVGCINSKWEPHFRRQGVPMELIKSNPRISIHAAAYILRYQYQRYGEWFKSVMAYHTGSVGTPGSSRYARGWYYAFDALTRDRSLTASPG